MFIARALIRISGDIRQYLIRESITAIQALENATALPVFGQLACVAPSPALGCASGCQPIVSGHGVAITTALSPAPWFALITQLFKSFFKLFGFHLTDLMGI